MSGETTQGLEKEIKYFVLKGGGQGSDPQQSHKTWPGVSDVCSPSNPEVGTGQTG